MALHFILASAIGEPWVLPHELKGDPLPLGGLYYGGDDQKLWRLSLERVTICLWVNHLMTEVLNTIESGHRRISNLKDAIRDFINTGRHQSKLLDVKQTWNQICGSLDVIDETTLLILDYLASRIGEIKGQNAGWRLGFLLHPLQALFKFMKARFRSSCPSQIKARRCLTLRSTRTPPARPAILSLVSSFITSFSIRSQIGPVSFFR